MSAKKNILILITILMVCVFSLVSCDIMGIEIAFLSKEPAEASTTAEPQPDVPETDDQSTSDNCLTTTSPTTTTTPTTTNPPVTAPSIENGGANTDIGHGPIGTPEA